MVAPRLTPAPNFDDAFRARLAELIRWRRDVRRFRRDPLPDGTLDRLVELAIRAPSVGYSQPWRWVRVVSPDVRSAVADNFSHANADALQGYRGERAKLYASLKLAGLDEAPEHLAVFAEEDEPAGHGLGRATMPETLAYSVVMAIHTVWLAARAEGIGLGWISILDPDRLGHVLDVPSSWRFIAYLCIGYPAEETSVPELARSGWERADSRATTIHRR
ncbi:MAG: 5,6-dimethylbenzimidazole synthase [Gemmatimonas sp.]